MGSGVAKMSPSSQKETDIVRVAIWLLSILVFLGYLMMWVMTPTTTYRRIWLPNIRKNVNSVYFGVQGATILTFSFPVLFIAVLGCVYLHLGKRSGHNNFRSNGRKHPLATWKKPMLVKGPLGIVSGIELAFLTMFVALLTWSLSTYLHNGFATITPHSAAKSGERVWEAKLESSAIRLGVVGNICLTFLFFPVARGSSVLPLFGLTSEGSIKYHIWLGHLVMVFFTAHGLSYISYWAVTHQISEMLKWRKADFSNVAGEVALLAGLGLWAATFPRIRRKMFELFFYTHHLYILFVFFFLMHVPISFACIMLPGFYLFLVDRYLRFLQSRTNVRLVSARILPCETLEINFSKSPGLSYNPTSILFVNVPSISKLQWHPFTITSSSNLEPEKLSVMIKSEGSWSKKLYQLLSSPSSVDRLEVSVEGPYGPASTPFLRHDALVMVSGGSGITPFITIIREIMSASAMHQCKTPQVTLICSVKNSSDLTMLDLLIPLSGTPSAFSNLQLKIEAYVTREKEPTIDNSKLTRIIWFKPHQTDAPISAILGPKSWLWLGAIISSSFISFLVIIGLITRYYIYPIDHNTNLVFSYSLRSFLNILAICVCIAITASAAVLWNKKQNAREAIQVQNIEGSTPVGSPGSWFYNGDRELESLPHKSLAEATNVHYGERPDLKRMLFECKGSSVGVLVCGPKKMRHEVATICSSGLADNLHFESISFSW
ncbi:ferric reduction oxidase 2 isoform X1 [Ricinus communis]|uniref:ferric reduction oxidase 2 isoform X1 n=2 Tax=Ricinus communis TaxID=3988 RepID=UPI00201A6260|nr:ferric reduction oxidase 2 isoform X1 [Ricinus communis]